MLSKYVVPGNKIDIQGIDRAIMGDKSNQKVYQTKVYDILSEERLEVFMPMEQTKLVLLPVDGEYDLYFYTKSGIYQCFGKVVDRYKNNGIYILLFELSTNLRKHQRREYYRFNCILNMQSRELNEEEVKSLEEKGVLPPLQEEIPSLKNSIIVDISGGGIRFVSNYQYGEGTHICLTYQLDAGGISKSYNLTGKILSSKEIPNRKGQYEHRVQYVDIDNTEREEIIRFIFEEERKNRQKSKGK